MVMLVVLFDFSIQVASKLIASSCLFNSPFVIFHCLSLLFKCRDSIYWHIQIDFVACVQFVLKKGFSSLTKILLFGLDIYVFCRCSQDILQIPGFSSFTVSLGLGNSCDVFVMKTFRNDTQLCCHDSNVKWILHCMLYYIRKIGKSRYLGGQCIYKIIIHFTGPKKNFKYTYAYAYTIQFSQINRKGSLKNLN